MTESTRPQRQPPRPTPAAAATGRRRGNHNGSARRHTGRTGGLLVRGVAAALIAGASLVPAGNATASDSKEPGLPELELQASATGFATHDEMVVHLNADQSGTDVGPLNDKVLEALRKALEATRGVAGVKARVGSVNTMPVHDKDGQRVSWRVVGTVVLEGTDLKSTGDLAGKLSQELQLASVQYRLTPARRAEAENKLIDEAAAAFRERAARTTKALGFQSFELKNVNVQTSTSGPRPPMPMMMKAAMARDMAAESVPADGGDATIDVTLIGTVRLR